MTKGSLSLAVHGGAFATLEADVKEYAAGCRQALQVGLEILQANGSSIDAVEAAVVELERNELFDAGRGAFLNEDGQVSLDAGIMDGETLACGAVLGLEHYESPVTVARHVLASPHAILTGDGAARFARRQGIAPSDASLVTARELQRWRSAPAGQADSWVAELFGDTVGAVARDRRGNLAAATSTGGSPGKPQGRVGDSPIIGAGLYADNETGAASATGHGERIIPLVWSKYAVDMMRELDAQAAADAAVQRLGRLAAKAGIVLVDRVGNVGVSWNTPYMAFSAYDGQRNRIASGPTAVLGNAR